MSHAVCHFILFVSILVSQCTQISAFGSITIPLDKQYVPVVRKGRTVMYKTAYFGKVSLGNESSQNFTMIFDTGSAHLFVPSSKCHAEACLTKKVYDRTASLHAIDIDHDGKPVMPNDEERDEVQIAYGTGEITGEFVREHVCFSTEGVAPACSWTRIVVATDMTEDPFGQFAFDGVLGLGLDALALDPEFSVFGQFVAQHPEVKPQFAFYLSRNDAIPSEITLGGHDAARITGDLQWADVVHKDLGYWMLSVESVRIGTEELELCKAGDCLAVTDTGTSLLGVPKIAMQRVNWLLARTLDNDPEQADCRQEKGPDIVINIGGVELTLGPEEYSRPAGLRVVDSKTNNTQFLCRAQLMPVDHMEPLGPKAWILGEPVLRKYYSVFDWANKRVGFAPAAQAANASSPSAASGLARQGNFLHRIFGAPTEESLVPTVVHV